MNVPIDISTRSMTYSPKRRAMPFRVDYAGDVIDINKASAAEDEDAVMELGKASSTDSETEVPLPDNDINLDTTHSSKDHTIRTECTESESLASSVCSSGPEDPATTTALPVPPAAPAAPLSPRNSRVSFSQITIREYPIIVGDNPSVLTGTPVTIDWEHVEEMEFLLDEYEEAKTVQRPRTLLELRMPATHRDKILKSQGFSLAERNQGKRLANLTKNRRKRTGETMQLAKAAEAVEGWKRATKNATWGRKRKQEERNFLLRFREH